MRTFKDLDGREWQFELTLGNALKIDQADIKDTDDEPIKLVDGDPQAVLKQVTSDYVILQLAGVMVRNQLSPSSAENINPLQTEFYDRVDRALLVELKYIIWEELADFFLEATILFSRLIKSHKDLLRRGESLQRKVEGPLDAQLKKIVDDAEKTALASIEEQSTTTI